MTGISSFGRIAQRTISVNENFLARHFNGRGEYDSPIGRTGERVESRRGNFHGGRSSSRRECRTYDF